MKDKILSFYQKCLILLAKRVSIMGLVLCNVVVLLSCSNEDIKPYNDRLVSGELNQTHVGNDTFLLDLNGDNKPDYKMGIDFLEATPLSSKICIRCLDDNKVLFDKSLKTGDAELLPLNYGDEITGYFSYANPCLISPVNKFSWAGKGPLYLGLKLEVDNNVQYGWMQVEVDPIGKTLYLYDYGFRLGAFPIKAGEK